MLFKAFDASFRDMFTKVTPNMFFVTIKRLPRIPSGIVRISCMITLRLMFFTHFYGKCFVFSFLFTMNPNFIPKNPTTVGNILALEKIYGYISDFFYENEISFNCANSGSYQKMSHAIVPYTDPSSK